MNFGKTTTACGACLSYRFRIHSTYRILSCMEKKTLKKLVKLVLAILIIAAGYVLGRFETGSEFITRAVGAYGYTGVFIMSVISGFNLIVPVPFITFLPLLLAEGLLYIPTTLAIAAGLTFGDLIGYVIGLWGRDIAGPSNNKTVIWLLRIKERYYWAPLCILFLYSSFIPFSNEVLVIPLGFLRYNIVHIFLITLVGNIIFSFLSGATIVGTYSFF